MARRTDLLPEIADLCKEVNHADLAIEVAHVDGWLPYATAEAAAACRRGLAQMFAAAA